MIIYYYGDDLLVILSSSIVAVFIMIIHSFILLHFYCFFGRFDLIICCFVLIFIYLGYRMLLILIRSFDEGCLIGIDLSWYIMIDRERDGDYH